MKKFIPRDTLYAKMAERDQWLIVRETDYANDIAYDGSIGLGEEDNSECSYNLDRLDEWNKLNFLEHILREGVRIGIRHVLKPHDKNGIENWLGIRFVLEEVNLPNARYEIKLASADALVEIKRLTQTQNYLIRITIAIMLLWPLAIELLSRLETQYGIVDTIRKQILNW